MADTLSHIKQRLTAMQSARSEFETEWDLCDLQFKAESYEDPVTGRFMYNDDMEQSLIEMEVGRTAWEIIFDVKPSSYDTDIEKLEASKHILRAFLEKENAYREIRTFKQDKARYGTGIFFTWIRYDTYYIAKAEDQTVKDGMWWFYTKKFKRKIKVDERMFTPTNIPIRSVYLDDRFIRQNNPDKLEDCILKETVTYETLEQRYKGKSNFSQDWIGTSWTSDNSPAYWVQPQDQNKLFQLYHYYNRKTRMYAIMIDERFVLYEGEMQYIRSALPIRIAQHYPNSACVYGVSIPQKVRSYKAVKINMMQSIIDWARLGSGKLLATSNWSEFLDNIYVPSGWIWMAELSMSVDNIKEIDTRVDMNWPISAIDLIDKWLRESTGLDIGAPFETKDETLGQTEIREQNKVTRHKAMDEIYNQCLDLALTDTLENISQFAPTLLRTTKDIKMAGKDVTTNVERPTIKIENVKIEKKRGQTVIEEDFGSYWYLKLEPTTLPWDCMVHVTTPYTNNIVKDQIDKAKSTELITNIVSLWGVYWQEVMIEKAPIDEVWSMLSKSYWFEEGKFSWVTKKERARREAAEKIKKLKQMTEEVTALFSNPWQDVQNPIGWSTETVSQTPTIPQGQPMGIWGVQ